MGTIGSILRTEVKTILRYPDHDSTWQNWGMDIRDRIRMVIDQNPEMSIRSVSLAAGLSDSMLGKILNGSVESPTLKTVDKLAEALGVDARWLAYGEGDPEPGADLSALIERYHMLKKDDRAMVFRVVEGLSKTGTDG